MYNYRITFFTGKQSWAGTNANVFITMYGTVGDSDVFRFENQGLSTFENGMKNSFIIDTSYCLGNLVKVNVGHDNSGLNPGWYLEKIDILDTTTGELFIFECHKWFDSGTDDGKIVRDVRRTNYDMNGMKIETPEPVEKVIKTTKEIRVEASKKLFTESSSSVEEVMIMETQQTDVQSASMSLDDWLGEEEEAQPQQEEEPQSYEHTIIFYTGAMAFAGTNANVLVTLYGDDYQTEKHRFPNKAGNSLFEKGMANSFPIESKIPVQGIRTLRVSHDNAGMFPGWYIIKIALENKSTAQTAVFPCNQWLEDKKLSAGHEITCLLMRDRLQNPSKDLEEPKGKTNKAFDQSEIGETQTTAQENGQKKDSDQIDLASDLNSMTQFVRDETRQTFGRNDNLYTIHVVSEVSHGALVDDNVTFTLYGENSQSEEQKFDQSERTCEKRMRGTLEMKSRRDLGPIQKIKIGFDKTKENFPWILVVVVDHKSNENVVFICDRCFRNGAKGKEDATQEYAPVFVNPKNDVIALDKDECRDWTLDKSNKGAVIRTKSEPNVPAVVKAVMKVDGISFPFKTAKKCFSDWEKRMQWDETLTSVNVLEKIENFTLVQCSLKMPTLVKSRDVVLACLDYSGQQSYMQIMCSTSHPRDLITSNRIRANCLKSSIIIRQSANDSAMLTAINQIELGGWLPGMAKVDFVKDTHTKQVQLLKEYASKRVSNGQGKVKLQQMKS